MKKNIIISLGILIVFNILFMISSFALSPDWFKDKSGEEESGYGSDRYTSPPYNVPKEDIDLWRGWIFPERDMIFYPGKIISLAGINRGDTVADIGASVGYLTFPIARSVGPEGKCYALDIIYTEDHFSYIDNVISDTKENPHSNVEFIMIKMDDICMPDESIDVGIMVLTGILLNSPENYKDNSFVIEISESHQRLAKSIFDALKPGGNLVVIDRVASEEEKIYLEKHLPIEDVFIKYSLDKNDVKKNYEKAGFILRKEYDLFLSKEHKSNIEKFKKSDAYKDMDPRIQDVFVGEMFFFLFKKPKEG